VVRVQVIDIESGACVDVPHRRGDQRDLDVAVVPETACPMSLASLR